MHILNRVDFIALKGEVLYAKYVEGEESVQLNIKTEDDTDPFDWMKIPLNPVDLVVPTPGLTGSEALHKAIGKLPLPIEFTPEADNELGPDDEKYIVFDRDDVDALILRLVEVCRSMANPDRHSND